LQRLAVSVAASIGRGGDLGVNGGTESWRNCTDKVLKPT
jgi:hypothetical protein